MFVTCGKFGNVPLSTISGHKFYDKNLDGVWDEEEPGLSGWTIKLQNNSLLWPGIWMTYATTTTDANGFYEFTDVKPNPGMYRIVEVKKSPEWVMTTSILMIDLQKPLEPTCGEDAITGKNIGNALMARVEGVTFQDFKPHDNTWPNGVQDGVEPGLPGWTITLQGRTITGQLVNLVTFTKGPPSTVGSYNFSVLPGTYWVNETEKIGWTPTTPISNMIIVVAYPPSQVKVRVNFGNTLLNFDPEIPFVLQKGTNLWSTPMAVSGLSAKSLLAAIGPSATSVTKINKATGKLQSFMPNFPDALNFPLAPGEGCYVVVKQTVQFTLLGDLVGPTVTQLVAGTNLIGFASSNLLVVKASALLGMVSGCNAKSITYLDAAAGKLRSYMPGFPSALDFDVVPGLGYYLTTDGPGTLTVA
jgi:hypothetical protein